MGGEEDTQQALRLRVWHGCCLTSKKKWSFTTNDTRECGAPQTMDHLPLCLNTAHCTPDQLVEPTEEALEVCEILEALEQPTNIANITRHDKKLPSVFAHTYLKHRIDKLCGYLTPWPGSGAAVEHPHSWSQYLVSLIYLHQLKGTSTSPALSSRQLHIPTVNNTVYSIPMVDNLYIICISHTYNRTHVYNACITYTQ